MDSRKQRKPARQNIGLRMGTKESKGPVEDTIPKDTDFQNDEPNDNQPDPHKEELPTNQASSEETHKPGEHKSANQGDSSEQPADQPEEQRQTLGSGYLLRKLGE